jgi:serine phosphatase RsbU (regulator of sigma subunit)
MHNTGKIISMLVFALLVGICNAATSSLSDSLWLALKTTKNDSLKISILTDIANSDAYKKSDSAFILLDEAIGIASANGLKDKILKLIENKGFLYNEQQKFSMALFEYKKVIQMASEQTDSSKISIAYSNLGNVYLQLQLNEKALESYGVALKYMSLTKDSLKTAVFFGRIGNLHLALGHYNDAKEYYERAKYLFEKTKNKRYIPITLQNIGIAEKNQGNYQKAIEYYNQAIVLHRELNSKLGEAQCLGNIGGIYFEIEDYSTALKWVQNAIKIFREQEAEYDLSIALLRLGKTQYHLAQYHDAKQSLDEALAIGHRMGDVPLLLLDLYEFQSKVYHKLGDNSKAYALLLNAYELYAKEHSARNSEIQESLRISFEVEQKEKDMELLRKDIDLKEATINRKNTQLLLYLMATILSLLFVLLLFRLNRLKQIANRELLFKNNEINQQKEEIEAQRDEIEAQKEEIEAQRDELEIQRSLAIAQRDEIFRKNIAITDSIEYAKHIQTALLPNKAELNEALGENFIFFQPLDIVSGDFYWISPSSSETILAVADCTGHGVPGALMSVMGINYLSSIVNENRITQPANVLHNLNDTVKAALSHAEASLQNKDGMDIALVNIDWQTLEMSYSSANIKMLIWRNGEVMPLSTNKISIGKSPVETKVEFDSFSFQLKTNDVLYLFTDGYIDQFGGPEYKKFLLGRLKNIIQHIGYLPLNTQHKKLEDEFNQWKRTHHQIDDVLVVAIKI